MADGKTHELINTAFLGGALLAYDYARANGLVGFIEVHVTDSNRWSFVLAYLVGTFLLTPDLDLSNQSVRAKSNWGILGHLWRPYGLLFSHRGISHSWLAGPLTRLAYLAFRLLGFAYVINALAPSIGLNLNLTFLPTWEMQPALISIILGYYVSQWVHLVTDGILPGTKRKRRRRRR
jgi:uncharacterized metal-binding protein